MLWTLTKKQKYFSLLIHVVLCCEVTNVNKWTLILKCYHTFCIFNCCLSGCFYIYLILTPNLLLTMCNNCYQLHYGPLTGFMRVMEHIGEIEMRVNTDFKKNNPCSRQNNAALLSTPLAYCGSKMLSRLEENRQGSQNGLILL